jgi:ABC-type dipeptide/oligopeptide/nickel transport system ATPase component
MSPAAELLSVRDLAVDFVTEEGTIVAVDGVSFDLREGEILALVGESGCGKSATALALLRLIADPPGRITRGAVLFRGRDLLQASDREIREVRGNRIAMIFQEPMTSLNPVLTIGRQVGEPLRLHKGLHDSALLERCAALLESVSIPEARRRLADYPHRFSGGMRQRVMIAMGMGCQSRHHHRRRADDGARRHHPGAAARAAAPPGRAASHGADADHPQSRHRRALRRPGERDVCRPHRRKRRTPTPSTRGRAIPTRSACCARCRGSTSRRRQAAADRGQPPDALAMPTGCAFHPRCPTADRALPAERPPLRRSATAIASPAGSTSMAEADAPLVAVRGLEVHFRSRAPRAARGGRCMPSTASTSTSRAARRSAWSARAAAASRPSVAPSCSWCGRPRAGALRRHASSPRCRRGELRPMRRRMQMVFQDPFSSLNRA